MNARKLDAIVGRGMLAVVERTNGAVTIEQRLRELEDENRALTMHLENARTKIVQLEARLGVVPAVGQGKTYKGRPVISMSDAAATAGVSLATASRYLLAGRWQGVKQANEWMVFSDQPLRKKTKTERKQRQTKR